MIEESRERRQSVPRPLLLADEHAAFMAQVRPVDMAADACWLWTGDTLGNGAGAFTIRDHTYQAHRVMWVNRGPLHLRHQHYLSPNVYLAHTCGDMRCVRPEHMEVLLRADVKEYGDDYIGLNANKDRNVEGHKFDAVNGSGNRLCTGCSREQKHGRSVMDRALRVIAESLRAESEAAA